MVQQNDYQFIQVPIAVFYLMDADCSKVLTTLIQMQSFYPKTNEGYFECPYKVLEVACGLSQNIINACLAGLYIEGLIDVISFGKGKGKHTNRYKVNVEKFKDYEKTPVGIAIMTEDKPIHKVKYKGTRFKLPWSVFESDDEVAQYNAQQTAQCIAQHTAQKVTTNINNIENIYNIDNIDNITKEDIVSKETKNEEYYLLSFLDNPVKDYRCLLDNLSFFLNRNYSDLLSLQENLKKKCNCEYTLNDIIQNLQFLYKKKVVYSVQ